MLLFAADGWIVAGYVFAWQIALFLTLGESFTAFGGVLALAALVGAVAGLVLGKHIDAGRGLPAVWLTFGSLAAVTVLRAISTEMVAMAVIANALGALAVCLYMPTLMTSVYNQAKRSPCPLRFHVATEAGWDIGGASGCVAAATLSALGAPLSSTILLSLAGSALSLFLLTATIPASGSSRHKRSPNRQSAIRFRKSDRLQCSIVAFSYAEPAATRRKTL